MPLLETRGAASAKGFGLTGSTATPVYIEDVFSTYLYTGDSSYRLIINNINLEEFGGTVIVKGRSSGTQTYDTDNVIQPAGGFSLSMDNENPRQQNFNFAGFSTNGFVVWSPGPFGFANTNTSGVTYTSWAFRKQPKFFDVVTWVGDGSSTRTINHNLGSVPGCIITKAFTATNDWWTYHRAASATPLKTYARVNSTDPTTTSVSDLWGATSTTITVASALTLNDSGVSYVAYLFAHDAGGFGASGTDNVISCGSFTGAGAGSTITVNLGWEPQWLMFKRTDGFGDWIVIDNRRGWTTGGDDSYLRLNTPGSETSVTGGPALNATGFTWNPASGTQFIYIAIRRGPMKTPTTGTSVFDALSRIGNGTTGAETVVGFPVDMVLNKRLDLGVSWNQLDRLRGNPRVLFPNLTDAEINLVDFSLPATNGFTGPNQNSYYWPTGGTNYNGSGVPYASYFFRRAPGFFDEVCYTGNFNFRFLNHNLGVTPELLIIKARSSGPYTVWFAFSSMTSSGYNYQELNWSGAAIARSYGFNSELSSQPNETGFYLGQYDGSNNLGTTYVAYLFASCPGVSKVGSYTGTGALQTINCGFTGGARFVLIKRTDSTGDWWVYDSARGITSGNDPYLFLNSINAEVTGTNYVDTTSVGFQVTAAAPAGLNANGGSYIFLAIA
jgi:hypothetical protein